MAPSRTVARLHAPPEQADRLVHVRRKRSGNLNRKIKPWRLQHAMIRIIKIIQNIDAATKGSLLVHHTQLAVQPAPAVGHQQTQPLQASPHRRVNAPLHTCLFYFLLPFWTQGF